MHKKEIHSVVPDFLSVMKLVYVPIFVVKEIVFLEDLYITPTSFVWVRS